MRERASRNSSSTATGAPGSPLPAWLRGEGCAAVFVLLCIGVAPVCWAEELPVVRDGGFSLAMRALPLDAVHAFFLARGFRAAEAKRIVEVGCVHKLAATHDGDGVDAAVSIDLAAWRVRSAEGPWRPLALREEWAQTWEKMNVAKPAQIAFYWALFPTQQIFAPGDRNWGMVPMGFAPGTPFDLKAVWYVGEKRLESVLTHLQCASPEAGT
ncbi:MAG: hypothetical protein HQL90_10315 [Magnetococcales bacterium]|nr:hypothetical protein [Magnetococcales bacterium]